MGVQAKKRSWSDGDWWLGAAGRGPCVAGRAGLGVGDEKWRLRPECLGAGCRVFHHPSGHEASPRERFE